MSATQEVTVESEAPRLLHAVKFVLLALFVGGLVWLALRHRDLLTGGALAAAVEGFGVWAPLLYVVIYGVAILAVLPGAIFLLAAGLAFPYWQAVAYVVIASMVGAAAAFQMARGFGRGFVTKLLHHRVKAAEQQLQRHAVLTVTLSRLLLLPYGPVSYGMGLTSIRFQDYLLGTFLGILPSTLLFVRLFAHLGRAATLTEIVTSIDVWVTLALSLAVAAGAWWLKRRLAQRGELPMVELEEEDG